MNGDLQDCLRSPPPELPTDTKLFIAYSGGMDSHVLLHLAAAHYENVTAIHVHHGLQAVADDWTSHCENVCSTLRVPCNVIKVSVSQEAGESLEAAARDARYAAFTEQLDVNDVLLMAHHADDQAETLLLNLLKGAGPQGLAAMPVVRKLGKGWLWRPLLSQPREALAEYARRHHLKWIDDPSNTDTQFDRNFLRQDILPRLKTRWPGLQKTLSRAATHQQQVSELLTQLSELDWQQCRQGAQLSITQLQLLPQARQENLLRFWLRKYGFPLPSVVKLANIFDHVIAAAPDRQPLVIWPGVEIRRFDNLLYALPPLPTPPENIVLSLPDETTLPLGKLHTMKTVGAGLKSDLTELTIRFRQGGETCRLHGQTQSVKKLLNASNIPPWLRPYLPMIYSGDTLAAIPGVMIADGFSVEKNEAGLELCWEYEGLA